LESTCISVSSPEMIMEVATVSANNDSEVGQLIQDAIGKVGKEGVVTVEASNTFNDDVVVTPGMRFDRGYISVNFINDRKAGTCDFEEPFVLLHEHRISGLHTLLPIVEAVYATQRPLLIIAEDVDREALATLIYNKLQNEMKVCAVKAPDFAANRTNNLQDIATLTGGVVVNEGAGVSLEGLDISQLGQAKKVTVSEDSTVILEGAGDKADIEKRCGQLRQGLADSLDDHERAKLRQRLAKLTSGVAVLKVGGSSDVEMGERKDRVEDALFATQAAIEEGVVPGGGAALLHASKVLYDVEANLSHSSRDAAYGVRILRNAVQSPLRQIVANAGEEGGLVAAQLLQVEDGRQGYNALTGEYVDMIEEGILDPLKVVKTGLVDAVGVSALLMTVEASVADFS